MSTFNGIGTMYYGRDDPWPDGSYVTTEWVVVFWIPLYPTGSFRVTCKDYKPKSFLLGSKTTYEEVPVPLNRKQVIKAYAIVAAIAIVCIILSQIPAC